MGSYVDRMKRIIKSSDLYDGSSSGSDERFVDLAREADLALAEQQLGVTILENKLKVERGYQEKLTALNIAKQELIDWLSTQLDGFFEPYEGDEITEYKRLVARIRSLEDE